ncbi:hypothetical protein KQX54_016700 [Cotesia glomerata]|uniref:Uncharacterized protein n=1 Tax=Cotesia glomerata TaxID=32391 RepID=A0AAV7IFW8_COTGL|nr:hypothetical protein KQX54_016700 [Cotesia glomerata]
MRIGVLCSVSVCGSEIGVVMDSIYSLLPFTQPHIPSVSLTLQLYWTSNFKHLPLVILVLYLTERLYLYRTYKAQGFLVADMLAQTWLNGDNKVAEIITTRVQTTEARLISKSKYGEETEKISTYSGLLTRKIYSTRRDNNDAVK